MSTTAEQGWARAVGAGSKMTGTYSPKGDASPMRAGSGSAEGIPSRVGSQLRYRSGLITDLQGNVITDAPPKPAAAPAPAPMRAPVPAQAVTTPQSAPPRPAVSPLARMAHPSLPPVVVQERSKSAFAPRSTSVVARVIAHLKGKPEGAYLTADRLQEDFGMARTSFYNLFQKAWDAKALIRLTVDGRAAVALPSAVHTPEASRPPLPAAALPDPAVRQLAGRAVVISGSFVASLWADGELELCGIRPDPEGLVLDAEQTRLLARLFACHHQSTGATQ